MYSLSLFGVIHLSGKKLIFYSGSPQKKNLCENTIRPQVFNKRSINHFINYQQHMKVNSAENQRWQLCQLKRHFVCGQQSPTLQDLQLTD